MSEKPNLYVDSFMMPHEIIAEFVLLHDKGNDDATDIEGREDQERDGGTIRPGKGE